MLGAKKSPASGWGREAGKAASGRLGPRRRQATDDADTDCADRSRLPARARLLSAFPGVASIGRATNFTLAMRAPRTIAPIPSACDAGHSGAEIHARIVRREPSPRPENCACTVPNFHNWK